MKKALTLLILLTAFLSGHSQVGHLPRTTPESVGIPSRALARLTDSLMALPRTALHSLVVLRHGKVAYECYPQPFSAESGHTLYSCSKTFVAAAIGIAIDEGLLRLDSPVANFFPMTHRDSVNYRRMTVRHLLTMSSGITPDWNFRNVERLWTHYWLSKPVATPGNRFQYDSMCTYLLSAILQKATGMTTLDYLKARLFTPMNITEVGWEESPEGFNTGGWGLHLQAESLAKFGLLLLQGGKWQGRQLISRAWVEEMMKPQIDNGGAGYGYQMWRCEYPGASRADGAYGQYILVVPDKDMVVVITECSAIDGVRQRRLVWNHLLPQVKDTWTPISDDSNRHFRRLATSRRLPLPEGKRRPPRHMPRSVTLPLENNAQGWSSLRIERTATGLIFSYQQQGKQVRLPMTYGQWTTTRTPVTPPYSIHAQDRFKGIAAPFTVAAGYGFTSDGTLHLRLHYTNWITVVDITIRHLNTPHPSVTIHENFN